MIRSWGACKAPCEQSLTTPPPNPASRPIHKPPGDADLWLPKRSELSDCWQMHNYYIYNKYFIKKIPTLSLYQKSFINNNTVNKIKHLIKSNKIKNKLRMKATHYACFKLKEKHCEKYHNFTWFPGVEILRKGNSGDLPETMRKLSLSAKFQHQEIRWHYGIFPSESHQKRLKRIKTIWSTL